MGKEIERKFLVVSDAYRKCGERFYFKQGYLCTDPQRVVRVRVIGEKGYITVKGANAGIVRSEYEYEIPATDAQEMLDQLCQRPLIEKYRYKISFEGNTWEVDEFMGENSGLILAEIELPSADSGVIFPTWIGREVSDDPRYYNSNLVKCPYSTW